MVKSFGHCYRTLNYLIYVRPFQISTYTIRTVLPCFANLPILTKENSTPFPIRVLLELLILPKLTYLTGIAGAVVALVKIVILANRTPE